MNPLTMIPALYRKYIYFAFAVVGVGVGATDVALDPNPSWLTATIRVLAYLTIALGLTAGSNVTSDDRPEPAPAPDNPRAD